MFGLTPYEKKSYDLFNVFHDFEKDFFNDSNMQLSTFSTDIRDDGNKYVLEAELPGFDKSDINIDVDNGYLTITASHSAKNDEKDGKGKYIRRERSYSSYSRSFDIANINADDIKAAYTDGVLTLDLPKKEETKPKATRIAID